MIKITFKFFLSVFLLNSSVFAYTYQVLDSIAKPVALLAENQKTELIQKTIIEQDFKLKTNDQQFAKINLNNSYEVSLFNNSEILVQSTYTYEGLPTLSVQFLSGQLYIKKLKNVNTRLQLKSVFFDWSFDLNATDKKNNLNLWLMLDLEKPSIHFCNREGEAEISLFDHEKKINLKSSESVIFQGQFVNKKIDFDILLKGRKIPKGHWQEQKKCSFDQLIQIENNILKADQALKQTKIVQQKKNQTEKKANDSKFLCHNPYGQLNDCAWVKSGQKCQRTRCDAQGKWSDLQIISSDRAQSCSTVSTVFKCDY